MRRFAITLFPLAICAKLPLVAIDDLSPRGVTPNDAIIVTDRLRSELLQTGKVRVLERGEMDKILKEQGFQGSGACDKSDCAVEVGKLLSVDRMAVGTVGRIGDLYTLSVRLLDVGTGEVLYTANQDYGGRLEGLLTESVPPLAAKLASGALRTAGKEGAIGVGDLHVTTQDPNANLIVDGIPIAGHSPFTVEKLAAGEHFLVARTDDLYGSLKVDLERDDLLKVNIAMRKGEGRLKVFSSPAGAKVLLDGVALPGETPLKADHVPAGSHTLVVRAQGFFNHVQAVNVALEELTEVRTVLSPSATLHLVGRTKGLALVLTNGTDSIPVVWREFVKDHKGEEFGRASMTLRPGNWIAHATGPDWDTLDRTYPMSAGQDLSDTLAPVPRWTRLRIRSNIPSLVVWNQDTLGRTRSPESGGEPVLVTNALPGTGRLCLHAPMMDSNCVPLSLQKGRTVDLELGLASRFARLEVYSNVEALIRMDGTLLGSSKTGAKPTPWLACDTLIPGDHSVELQAPGFDSWSVPVSLQGGMAAIVRAELQRTNAWTDSVSKADRAFLRKASRWIAGSGAIVSGIAAVYLHRDAMRNKSLADESYQAYLTAKSADDADRTRASHGTRIDRANERLHQAQACDAIAATFGIGFLASFAF